MAFSSTRPPRLGMTELARPALWTQSAGDRHRARRCLMGKPSRPAGRLLAGAGLAALGFAATSSSAQSASTLCVGGGPGCYATIQAALAAASDGDTIDVAPGTYA